MYIIEIGVVLRLPHTVRVVAITMVLDSVLTLSPVLNLCFPHYVAT